MALNSLGLGFTFTAKDLATGVMNRVGQALDDVDRKGAAAQEKWKQGMGTMAKGAATMVAGMGGMGVVRSLTKDFMDYEMAISEAAVMTGIEGKGTDDIRKKLKGLSDDIRKVNADSMFSSTEAAKAVAELGSRGLDAKQAMQALKPTMDLATVSYGRLDLAMSAGVGMVVLNAFGEKTEMLAKRNAQLAIAAKESAFNYADFETALRHAAPMAKTAGQSFESMTAYLGMMRDTGNDAATAATGYKEALSRITTHAQARNRIEALGVNVFDKQTGKMRDLAQIMRDLIPQVQAMNDKERITFLRKTFGIAGLKVYTSTFMSYTKALAEGKVKAGDYIGRHGQLVDAFGKAEQTVKGQLDTLKATDAYKGIMLKKSWEEVKLTLGEAFMPVIQPVIRALRTITSYVREVMAKYPGLAAFLGKVLGYGGAILMLAGAFKVLRGLAMLLGMGGAGGWLSRFIGGQAAATAATNATTAAVVRQQAAVAGGGRLAMAASVAGTILKAAGGAALIYTMRKEIVSAGKGIGRWAANVFGGGAADIVEATQATIKWDNALELVEARMRAAQGRQEDYRDSLRKTSEALVEFAGKSSGNTEKALVKLSERLAGLKQSAGEAYSELGKAYSRKDVKAVEEWQRKIYEIENRMTVMNETAGLIALKESRRELSRTTDAGRRAELQRSIWAQEVNQFQIRDREFNRWKKTQETGIQAMQDEQAKSIALKAFNKELERRSGLLDKEEAKLAGGARALGLQTDKGGSLRGRALRAAAGTMAGKAGTGYEYMQADAVKIAMRGTAAEKEGLVPKYYWGKEVLAEEIRGMREKMALAKGASPEQAAKEGWDVFNMLMSKGRDTTWDGGLKSSAAVYNGKTGKWEGAAEAAAAGREWIPERVQVEVTVKTDEVMKGAVAVKAAQDARNGKPLARVAVK